MMCVRMYVSVTLRNVAVTSRRNVASMMRIRTPSILYFFPCIMQCSGIVVLDNCGSELRFIPTTVYVEAVS